MNGCRHSMPCEGHGLCMLESSRSILDGQRTLVFHGRTEFTPMECDKDLFKVCPFKISKDGKQMSLRGTVKCEFCGKAHRPGSLNEKTCREWSSFKKAYKEMNEELPGRRKFYVTGTDRKVYSDDCNEFLRRQLWNKVKISILRRDRFTCQDCGRTYKEIGRGKNRRSGLEVHHIIPRALGGTDHPGNLKTVCMSCHRVYTNTANGIIRAARTEEKVVEENRTLEHKMQDETDVDDLAFE